MINRSAFYLILSFSLLALTSNAEVTKEESLESAELELKSYPQDVVDIVELSGLLSLSEQIKLTAQGILSGPKIEHEEKPAEMFSVAEQYHVARILAASWGPEALQDNLLALVDSLAVEVRKPLLTALRNKVIRSAQAKEKDSLSIQHSAEFQLYVNKLRQRPPSAGRWQLIETLDKQSGFSALIIKARTEAYKAITNVSPKWQPEEQWQARAKQEVLEFLFHAYRKTPNSDLQVYIKGFSNPALVELLNAAYKEL